MDDDFFYLVRRTRGAFVQNRNFNIASLSVAAFIIAVLSPHRH